MSPLMVMGELRLTSNRLGHGLARSEGRYPHAWFITPATPRSQTAVDLWTLSWTYFLFHNPPPLSHNTLIATLQMIFCLFRSLLIVCRSCAMGITVLYAFDISFSFETHIKIEECSWLIIWIKDNIKTEFFTGSHWPNKCNRVNAVNQQLKCPKYRS